MKPRACTRCRQWKVRCDADVASRGRCSRCRSLNVECLFDSSFKRVSRSKRLQEMQSEINQLRQAIPGPHSSIVPATQMEDGSLDITNPSPERGAVSVSQSASSPLSNSLAAPLRVPAGANLSETIPTAIIQQSGTSILHQRGLPIREKVIGDIRLTAGQVAELFRGYRAVHHQYLPFTILQSSELIYAKSPLLFWVICAVASSNLLKTQLEPHIRNLIADVLISPARSVETVQALLIICMWPFNCATIARDTSFFYSGLANQLGLQIGLHRPAITHTHMGGSEEPDRDADIETRLTTWLACFVVNDLQSSYRGVPPSILLDFNLLSNFDHPKVDPTLSRLCYISRLHIQSSLAIGAKAQNTSGLLDASSRTDMVALFGAQYAALWREHLQPMNDIVEVAFLSSRIQLWSFTLLDDMPFTPDLLEIFEQAERDAARLIQLGCERNLSMAPFHVRRSITYSAMILCKLLKSTHVMQHEVILDHIGRGRQALSSALTAENDVTRKAWGILQELPFLQDQKLTPQIFSRMTASIVYDSLRVWAENKYSSLNLVPQSGEIDLDGFDWDSLQL